MCPEVDSPLLLCQLSLWLQVLGLSLQLLFQPSCPNLLSVPLSAESCNAKDPIKEILTIILS